VGRERTWEPGEEGGGGLRRGGKQPGIAWGRARDLRCLPGEGVRKNNFLQVGGTAFPSKTLREKRKKKQFRKVKEKTLIGGGLRSPDQGGGAMRRLKKERLVTNSYTFIQT